MFTIVTNVPKVIGQYHRLYFWMENGSVTSCEVQGYLQHALVQFVPDNLLHSAQWICQNDSVDPGPSIDPDLARAFSSIWFEKSRSNLTTSFRPR